jgi:hypothetical protein
VQNLKELREKFGGGKSFGIRRSARSREVRIIKGLCVRLVEVRNLNELEAGTVERAGW